MKSVYTVVLLMLVVAASAFSQSYYWQHMGIFPPSHGVAGDTLFGNGMHGLATDPDGKIWAMHYYAISRDSLLIPNYMADKDTVGGVDSIEARKITVRALYCFNPDGTQPSWSPLKVLNMPGGKKDTIAGYSVYVKGKLVWHPTASSRGAGVGLRSDWQGNIYAVWYNNVYKINYKTGDVINKFVVNTPAGLVSPGVDQDGNVFINRVVTDGYPMWVYANDGNFLQYARDTLKGFSRAIDVSKDANDIYYAGYTLHAVTRYRNSTGLGIIGPWDQVDSVVKGFDCESFVWNKKTGQLWMSSGSYFNPPNAYPGTVTHHDTAAWYAYNPTTAALTGEKINWSFGVARNPDERPRGIAFSPGGDTAYACVFGGNAGPPAGLRWFTRKVTSVEQTESAIPSGYTLSQNYPNPFNPSTEIQFTLTKSGMTTLKVYDMLGQEVATLVNEQLNAGTFKSKFDAGRFSSGTYIYVLTSNGSRLVNKMLLMK
jgi:hypothetical protein